MKAVRNVPPGGVRVEEVDEPSGDGVLITVLSVGICASDFWYLSMGSKQIAGHEIAGVTDDGRAVSVEAMFGCGTCDVCRSGDRNRCVRGTLDVLGRTMDGGMSERFLVPARAVVELPAGLDARDASLVEPGSVAWHACARGQVGPDTRVAIVGAGAIGLLTAASAKSMGAAEVAIEARHRHQIAACEQLGAGEPAGVYDVVIETGGTESALHRSVELARTGGTVVYIGVYESIEKWPYMESFTREVALVPAIGYRGLGAAREFDNVARMLAAAPDLADLLITHRFPLKDAPEAFAVARDKSRGVFRVVVHPNDTL